MVAIRPATAADAAGVCRVATAAYHETYVDGGEDEPGTLTALYVHPDRWGECLGSRLFERARDHLAERGTERLRIRVFAENQVGRRFYEGRASLVEHRTDHLDPLDDTVATVVYETAVGAAE
jgi:GNAT superfamily N-acetyltransferase